MAATEANTKSRNGVDAARVKIVNVVPPLNNTEMGEVYLLIQDGHADTLKFHVRTAAGWKKSAALS